MDCPLEQNKVAVVERWTLWRGGHYLYYLCAWLNVVNWCSFLFSVLLSTRYWIFFLGKSPGDEVEQQQDSNASFKEDHIPRILIALQYIHHVYIWPSWSFVFCQSFINNSVKNRVLCQPIRAPDQILDTFYVISMEFLSLRSYLFTLCYFSQLFHVFFFNMFSCRS